MNSQEASATAIDLSIPCSSCQYNLRGLQSDGRCPECGSSIDRSIVLWKHKLAGILEPLESADPRWIRSLMEGAAWILLSLLLILILACAPPWVFEWKSTQRTVTLGVACSILIICSLGVWKLTTPEPDGRRFVSWEMRLVIRICAAIVLMTPIVGWILMRYWIWRTPDGIELAIGLLMTAIWIGGALSYYPYLRSIGRRERAEAFVWLATIVSIANIPIALSPLFPSFDPPSDSLSNLMGIPTLPFGPIENFVNIGRRAWQSYQFRQYGFAVGVIEVLCGMFLACTGAVHIGIFAVLNRARLRQASAVRKTAASSNP